MERSADCAYVCTYFPLQGSSTRRRRGKWFYTAKWFQFLFFFLPLGTDVAEWFLVIRLPDQSAKPLTISHNRISKRVESAKRLHRYLNFADDGNHARSTLQLHVSSGFCASVTLRSGVTQRGSQDRVLFVNLYPPDRLLHPFAHFFLSFVPLTILSPFSFRQINDSHSLLSS